MQIFMIYTADSVSFIGKNVYTMVHKNMPLLFLKSSVRHWPFLIIFGMRHQEETQHKWL